MESKAATNQLATPVTERTTDAALVQGVANRSAPPQPSQVSRRPSWAS